MDSPSNKPEKSYLSAAVESITPWSLSRSSTPKPVPPQPTPKEPSGLKNQHGGDHSVPPLYALSQKRYPPDCPPLKPRWFYAVDAPKRKPKLLKTTQEEAKPLPAPKKFTAFSVHDSISIENAFQKLVESQEEERTGKSENRSTKTLQTADIGSKDTGQDDSPGIRVPVQEDYLFDVDVERRELSPVYWLGPVYEVRRGSWFYVEGSTYKPCEENLAAQLEEGYLKTKPFRYSKAADNVSSRPSTIKTEEKTQALSKSHPSKSEEQDPSNLAAANTTDHVTDKSETVHEQAGDAKRGVQDSHLPTAPQLQTYRLFGPYMNSTVTYQDSDTAYISADSIMSRVGSTVYQRFSGGVYGTKVVRGYRENAKAKDTSTDENVSKIPSSAALPSKVDTPAQLRRDEQQQRLLKRRSAPAGSLASDVIEDKGPHSIMDSPNQNLPPPSHFDLETSGKQGETKLQDPGDDGENQAREIDHLILVTHGIGQRLGIRTESVNFVNDVNVLRENLKNVYSNSADLQALNAEVEKLPKNCRVQVLPVCWRHLLDFPRKGVRQSRKEYDIGDSLGDEEEYPSLEDITVEGVPFVRSLITDLALDVLLYQSTYREHIIRIVLTESNRIYNLFRQRNPSFKGKVSLIGHSLGSAIYFDILSRQKEDRSPSSRSTHRSHHRNEPQSLRFDFEVEDFYCLGSPVGLFQMLKGRTIAARHPSNAEPIQSPFDPDYMDDPFLAAPYAGLGNGGSISATTGLPFTISSPKCAQLYNIFHPTDPISYRLEPLIAPAMASMKPQALPYTKKGIFSTSATQGLTGIGAKVGQSVSGLWSSLSGGIMNSVLNRSLGLTNEDIARIEASSIPARNPIQSPGAGTNIASAGVIADTPSLTRQMTDEKMKKLAENTAAEDKDGTRPNARTLIDDDIETLYSGFQKRNIPSADWTETENARKLRREEMKVRALNRNGRVDYSIQETFLDYNPIAAIASHLAYWTDEDVSHFIMSQLLSRHRGSSFDKHPK
ncbi:DDHD domain-containing protein [Xylogone sp. PMI_703]|nr:DDHD domain-containing protein [Xylogone sp. PMI_703]